MSRYTNRILVVSDFITTTISTRVVVNTLPQPWRWDRVCDAMDPWMDLTYVLCRDAYTGAVRATGPAGHVRPRWGSGAEPWRGAERSPAKKKFGF